MVNRLFLASLALMTITCAPALAYPQPRVADSADPDHDPIAKTDPVTISEATSTNHGSCTHKVIDDGSVGTRGIDILCTALDAGWEARGYLIPKVGSVVARSKWTAKVDVWAGADGNTNCVFGCDGGIDWQQTGTETIG